MNINITNAASLFFPNPSLEMVYFEAIANAIDAKATLISIDINIKSFSAVETFTIKITDDGEGFTQRNFNKFSSLLEVEEEDHKGVGRLVYLKYFKEIEVESVFENNLRKFTFNNKFKGISQITKSKNDSKNTILIFSGYKLDRIKSYDFLKPKEIKKSILMHFFPLLYNKKILNEELKISIKVETQESNVKHNFYSDSQTIDVNDIADLEEEIIEAPELDMFEKLNLYYSVKENSSENSIITAICVDGRTIPIDIISKGGIPSGYEIVFLMYSNLFKGKVNSSRQELTLKDEELKIVKRKFSERVIEIFNNKIPQINERNTSTKIKLEDKFPHLQGYFNDKVVGLIDRNQALEIAQKKFFNDQKEILEASSLTNEQYEKSLEISSRVLTEYVLYRNVIINKLRLIDKNSSESDIHNIIIPMRKSFSKDEFHNDLFTNNAWLLDDKYMSYTTILSDLKMTDLLNHLSIEEEETSKDDSRPDIAIVFSDNPDNSKKVDVVIVELKKTNLKLAKKEEVVSQLRQRARKLLKYYGDKIQRIWFYGVVDFDSEFKISLLEDKYTRLYSNDSVFYKEHPIILDENKPHESIPVGLYVMSFEAFIEDAYSRNSTFLNLLKENLKQLSD
ncbi:ATP-binding protein [Flavobacterium sp. HJSW_4]|uniref:ATP-binding protein n=1 Tax=Flavobacterium sp. HJSW_4 TaxID=3344660 RepID=UPI0035F4A887